MHDSISENQVVSQSIINYGSYRDFMSELKEQLNLPCVGGELVARFVPGQKWMLMPENKIDRFVWEVRIVIAGPNARYNPGRACIDSNDFKKFIEIISKTLEKIKFLQSSSFSGEFSKNMEGFQNPTIEIKASSGNIQTHFWVSNDTKWRFSRVLDFTDLLQMLEIFKTVEFRGDNLIESLKIIHA